MTKREQIDELYVNYMREFNENEIVLGSGNLEAKLLLIGEAPGKDEVKQSKPFVGAAGKNLSEFLQIIGVERESIFITNAIKYRLSKVNPMTGRVINRPAHKDEIIKNRDYLFNEIEIIKPDIIVTLGNVPLKSVLGDSGSVIGECHGTEKVLSILSTHLKLFPLYHPASIIYNRNLKDIYISDIHKLKALLD